MFNCQNYITDEIISVVIINIGILRVRVKYQISPSLLKTLSIWSLRFKKYQNDHRFYIPFATLVPAVSSLLTLLVNV